MKTKKYIGNKISLLKKDEKNFFENVDTKNISDSKTFWKTVKP